MLCISFFKLYLNIFSFHDLGLILVLRYRTHYYTLLFERAKDVGNFFLHIRENGSSNRSQKAILETKMAHVAGLCCICYCLFLSPIELRLFIKAKI